MIGTNMISPSKKGKKLYFDKATITKWILENQISTKEEMKLTANKQLMKKVLIVFNFLLFQYFFISP
jgi:hypothetical protein